MAQMDAVESIFYNKTIGAWFDFNMARGEQNTRFYTSSTMPLFANCYERVDLHKPHRLYTFLNDSGVFNFPGGIPASMIPNSEEQWDFPNGWPPTNHMIIEGLRKSENPEVQEQAFQLAKKWVLSNFKVYQATNKMWEKYDVSGDSPMPGSGGEYKVQDGFGWTNGAVLDLLVSFSDRLEADSNPNSNGSPSMGSYAPILLSLVLILAVRLR